MTTSVTSRSSVPKKVSPWVRSESAGGPGPLPSARPWPSHRWRSSEASKPPPRPTIEESLPAWPRWRHTNHSAPGDSIPRGHTDWRWESGCRSRTSGTPAFRQAWSGASPDSSGFRRSLLAPDRASRWGPCVDGSSSAERSPPAELARSPRNRSAGPRREKADTSADCPNANRPQAKVPPWAATSPGGSHTDGRGTIPLPQDDSD